jgi:Phasin protein
MSFSEQQGKSLVEPQVIEYGRRLLEFGFLNVSAALEGTRRLAGTRSPQEFFEVVVDLTREQFERTSEELQELSMLISPQKSENEKDGAEFWD